MTYFRNINDLQELRKQYKELLKAYHPDNANGSTEKCQEINAEYDRLFKVLKNKHESKQTSTDGAKADFNNYKYDFEADEALRNILQKIIHFAGITIDIVGCYIWIDGNSYPYKDVLKEIGFRWSGQRKKWYWTNSEYKRHSNKKMSYEDIQNKYGSTEIRTEERKLLKQA